MTRRINFRRAGFVGLAACALLGFAAGAGDAQTARRQKPKRTPLVVQTNRPAEAAPEVVSRADEYVDGNQIISPETAQRPAADPSADPNQEASEARVKELSERIVSLESAGGGKKDSDAKQKRLLLNLDILTRAEQRAETLRKQLFDLIEKESDIQMKLDQLENDSRPEMIERSVAFAGTLRPEELRELRTKNIESAKRNLQNLLAEIQKNKGGLELNVQKADVLVGKLRDKLEKEIDAALVDDPQQ